MSREHLPFLRLCLVLAALLLLLGGVAQSHRPSGGALLVLTGLAAAAAFLVSRRAHTCPHCGRRYRYLEASFFCPHCARRLRPGDPRDPGGSAQPLTGRSRRRRLTLYRCCIIPALLLLLPAVALSITGSQAALLFALAALLLCIIAAVAVYRVDTCGHCGRQLPGLHRCAHCPLCGERPDGRQPASGAHADSPS